MAGLQRRPGPRRIVMKVGSRLVTGGGRDLSARHLAPFVEAVVAHPETESVIVSSGAVAAGCRALGLDPRAATIPERQAAAAVGQSRLMRVWAELFEARGRLVGQVLLTNAGLRDRKRYVNSGNTLAAMFAAGVVPVVNENDTVSVDEIRVGDNDNLAAHTAALVDADLLVLFTDVAGVYDANPREDASARVVARAESAGALRRYCFPKSSAESTGGMETKLEAAEKAGAYGIATVIASGWDAAVVAAVFEGRPVGTRIEGSASPLPARKHWMATQTRVSGRIVVDAGAVAALRRGGRSLLASGITGVMGRFDRGDVVSIVDRSGAEWARGIAAYDATAVTSLMGRHSRDIEEVLGYVSGRVIVRADNLVMMRSA